MIEGIDQETLLNMSQDERQQLQEEIQTKFFNKLYGE